eukprot:CAMPEP_0117451462 /NCGR_PEP_ID=MMETSP0759-20121206/9017_1 /TAXON_ID=63605 /ORGANISM="Percolomonas cosmopolitus, Strain WS" /LENGTH=413 /DNA_ID=CAMNT_0005244057 /DNA_START=39 /DNA_END=1277 /DNA_ORIENTATION=-
MDFDLVDTTSVPDSQVKLSFLNMFSSLFDDPVSSDIRVKVGSDTTLHLHRIVLAAHSDKLKAMLYGSDEAKQLEEISLEEYASEEVITNILKFCYTGSISIKSFDSSRMKYISDQLQMKLLKGQLAQMLAAKVTKENVDDMLSIARQFCEPVLYDSCFKLMKQKDVKFAMENADYDELGAMLESSFLPFSEDHLIKVIDNFISKNSNKLTLEQQKQLWNCLRFPRLQGETLTTKLKELVDKDIIPLSAYIEALEYRSNPKMFKHVNGELRFQPRSGCIQWKTHCGGWKVSPGGTIKKTGSQNWDACASIFVCQASSGVYKVRLEIVSVGNDQSGIAIGFCADTALHATGYGSSQGQPYGMSVSAYPQQGQKLTYILDYNNNKITVKSSNGTTLATSAAMTHVPKNAKIHLGLW